MNQVLSIIGRERALIDKLTKVMFDAARRHHNYTPMVDTPRGSTFTVQILVDGEPTGRVARVNVELVAEEAVTEEQYVVRLWDGFDNIWMDVSGPMPKAEAEKLAGDKNEARDGSGAGNRDGHYDEIDYYKAWPIDTRMLRS